MNGLLKMLLYIPTAPSISNCANADVPWCIGRAASRIKEFHMLPVGDRLIRYDSIAVNTIVANSRGEVSSCDLKFK